MRIVVFFSSFTFAKRALAAARPSQPANDDEIAHNAESIHQEVVFQTSRKRLYEALLDSRQFTQVTTFSPVTKAAPAEIDRAAGGAFSCFDGKIVGRQIELVANERIVQAWRVAAWEPGAYSIAKFEFKDEGSQTRLVFDHVGFPKGDAETLAAGWKKHYWEPLNKYFTSM